jgi:hypothetical protein
MLRDAGDRRRGIGRHSSDEVRTAVSPEDSSVILTDNETKVDLLNNEAIAATIIRLLRNRPDHPVTVGVHGDWGAGKSSILEMIEAGLDGVDGTLCLKFNGWRFQGFEDAKIALIEGIVTALVEKRPALRKAAGALKQVFQRIDWLKLARRAGGLAAATATGIPTTGQLEAIVGGLKDIMSDPEKLATKKNIQSAIDGVTGLLKSDAESKNVPEEIREFRKAFDALLDEAEIAQLVVLIDDLDRCLPDTAIETLEAVRLFVFTRRTAFVVAADEAMIEYAVRKHFPDLPDTTGPRDYARNYLEKLVQVPFRIPALGEAETRTYVALLLIAVELGDDDPDYANLIAAAREQLTRPWESAALDAATVNLSLGEKSARAHNALTLSDQIGPILASGTKGNPRQIKRFLNSLLLRHQTAEARGFGDAIKLPVLAKLMLAERFQPRLFDQIAGGAATHPQGLCEELAQLESIAEEEGLEPKAPDAASKVTGKATSTDGAGESAKAGATGTRAQSVMLTEWLSLPQLLSWATIKPALADIDLRPYVFVTKDRKDYFGTASVLGHLATLVDQLLGPKFSVQGLDAELKQLAPVEADRAFEAVRARIMAGDVFETEPGGAVGLGVLVRAHPKLQTNLVDFLESLPQDRLGPWAVGGWTGVITDNQCRSRLERLIEKWSTSGSQMLRGAATSALRTTRGRR